MQLKWLGLFLFGLSIVALYATAQDAPPSGAAPGAATAPNFADGWRARFDQVYRLEDGQVLKYLPPPFIAERTDYYRAEHAGATESHPEPPASFNFRWRDPPLRTGPLLVSDLDFAKSEQPLSDVLTRVFRLRFYEFDGPEALLRMVLPGDWLIRAGSEIQGMGKLPEILSEARGKRVKVERETRPMESIVISGAYQFRPLPQVGAADRTVHVFIDTFETQAALRQQQTVPFETFLLQLEVRLRIRIASQVETPPISISIAYHPSAMTRDGRRPTTMESEENIRKFMDVLSSQTGLKLSREQPPVDVWRVVEDQ